MWIYSDVNCNNYIMKKLLLYTPELVVAGLSLLLISVAWLEKSWVVVGLLITAIIAPVLKFSIGSPTSGVWVVTSFLLSFMAWRLHVIKKHNCTE